MKFEIINIITNITTSMSSTPSLLVDWYIKTYKYEKSMIDIYTATIRCAQIQASIDNINSTQVVAMTIGNCNGFECLTKIIECKSMKYAVDTYKSKGNHDNKYNLEFTDNSKGTGTEILFDCQIKMIFKKYSIWDFL